MDEDPVIRELDVYLTDDTPTLSLFQFPLRPVYADTIEVEAAQLKPQNNKIELIIPFSNSQITADDSGAATEIKQKYHSSIVNQRACLAAGVIKDNALHLSPIDSVLQLRPSFATDRTSNGRSQDEVVDTAVIEEELANSGVEIKGDIASASADVAGNVSSGSMQQVQLRRRESERAQSLRLQSYAYLQSQEDQEPWVKLHVYDIGSDESETLFQRLYSTPEAI